MKTSTIVSAVLGFALLSSVGCAKTTDLGKMQEETIATVKLYLDDLDTLQRRWEDASALKSSAAPERLSAAKKAIDEGRTLAASAPTTIAAAAKTGKSDALVQANDNLLHDLAVDIEVATENLVAFETRANAMAYAPSTPVASPPPTTPAPTTGTPPDHATAISCDAEIALQCPDGQIDVCMKDPNAQNHGCVAK